MGLPQPVAGDVFLRVHSWKHICLVVVYQPGANWPCCFTRADGLVDRGVMARMKLQLSIAMNMWMHFCLQVKMHAIQREPDQGAWLPWPMSAVLLLHRCLTNVAVQATAWHSHDKTLRLRAVQSMAAGLLGIATAKPLAAEPEGAADHEDATAAVLAHVLHLRWSCCHSLDLAGMHRSAGPLLHC